jgi:hypothetical protein
LRDMRLRDMSGGGIGFVLLDPWIEQKIA